MYEQLIGNQQYQATIILPLGDSIYYVFNGVWSDTVAANVFAYPGPDQLRYHVVDMKANNYAGKVVKKNKLAMDSVYTTCPMTAVRHANGKDWWLVRNGVDMDSDSSIHYTFLVTKDTVTGPFVQAFTHPATGHPNISPFGQAAFSNDGKLYVNTVANLDNYIYVSDIDRCLGVFSNHRRIAVPGEEWDPIDNPGLADSIAIGLCFSPNDSLIYTSTANSIRQYDLYDTNPATAWIQLGGRDTTGPTFATYTTLYRGHDDKIYIGNRNATGNTMSVINNPNVKGMDADFCPKCMRYPKYYFNGLMVGCVSATT